MQWHEIEGFFGHLDRNFIANQCTKIKNGVVVEIGVFAGKSTVAMGGINKANNNQHYAIDNFRGGPDPPDAATRAQRARDIKSLFEQNMKDMGLDKYINLIVKDSVEAAKDFEDESIDFCFIDGDHSYNGVMSDLVAWHPKVKVGSVLAGHDYPWPPLKKAVHEFGSDVSTPIDNDGSKIWYMIKTKKF